MFIDMSKGLLSSVIHLTITMTMPGPLPAIAQPSGTYELPALLRGIVITICTGMFALEICMEQGGHGRGAIRHFQAGSCIPGEHRCHNSLGMTGSAAVAHHTPYTHRSPAVL